MASRYTSVKVSAGGRIVIPAEYRKAMGVRTGDKVLLSLKHGELRLLSKAQARKRAQDYVRNIVPWGVSLVDELIRERRADVRW